MQEAFALLILIACLSGAGYLLYLAYKQAKQLGLDLAAYLLKLFIEKIHTVLTFLLITSLVTEALIAGFAAEESVPKTVRLTLHITLMLVGLAGTAAFLQAIMHTASGTSSSGLMGTLLGRVFSGVIGLFLGLAVPFVNTLVAIKQIGGDSLSSLTVATVQHALGIISTAKYRAVIMANNLDPYTFSLLSHVPGTVLALIMNQISHLLVLILDVVVVYNFHKEVKEIKVESPQEVKEEPKEESKEVPVQQELKPNLSNPNLINQSIETLLEFIGVKDQSLKSQIMEEIISGLQVYLNPNTPAASQTAASIALRLSELTSRAREISASPAPDYMAKRSLVDAIKQMIRDPHVKGGLQYVGSLPKND